MFFLWFRAGLLGCFYYNRTFYHLAEYGPSSN